MAKGIREPIPHYTMSRAAAPMEMVYINTAGPFQESLGGSRCVMFVDSASRFQLPYGAPDKSVSVILILVKPFVAVMGVPRAFKTGNGAEYTNSTFVDYCNGLGTRCELTASYMLQQNNPVESGLSRAIKAGHAARLEVNKLFSDIHLERLKGVRDPDGSSLWMESVLWASEGFNRPATSAKSGMLSPHEVFFGDRPPMPVLPFCKPTYHSVPRRSKMDPQARPSFSVSFGYNHGNDCFKTMSAETGRVVHSRDVPWHQPRKPLISPAPTVGSGVLHLSSGAETPDYVYIQNLQLLPRLPPLQLPPHRCLHQSSPLQHPRSHQIAPAPIPDRVAPELGHEADVRMPGRARGETRTMRGSQHSMGLMFHAALAQQLATREAFDETFREHDLLKAEIYQLCQPLPRRRHRSTLRYDVVPGHGSSVA